VIELKEDYPRQGLRIRCEQGVHPEVKRACLEFAKWLRKEFEFPIRVVVYLKKDYQIKNKFTKELVSATFFAPFDKSEEPYIRIATRDYIELLEENGKDDALASILGSIAHELGHYYQWIDDLELDEEEAENESEYMLELYGQTRGHP
jgi:predicted ATPase